MITQQKEEPHQWQVEKWFMKAVTKLVQIKRREAIANNITMLVTEEQGDSH